VVVVAWICALFFALCGSALVASGVYEGGSAGVIGVGLGLAVCGGSIPFIRAARRMGTSLREEPVTEAERRTRRRKARAILRFYAGCVLSVVLLPAPATVRVIAVVGVVLVVPLVLIGEFDNAKRQ
jgi:hypothetical protein